MRVARHLGEVRELVDRNDFQIEQLEASMPEAMWLLASSMLGALSTPKKPGSSPTLYKTWDSTPSRIKSRWQDLVGILVAPTINLLSAAFLSLS